MNVKRLRFFLFSFGIISLMSLALVLNIWRMETAADHQQNYMTVQIVYIGSVVAGLALSLINLGLLYAIPKFGRKSKAAMLVFLLVAFWAQFRVGNPETNAPGLVFILAVFLLIGPLVGIVFAMQSLRNLNQPAHETEMSIEA